jgi:aryl-alcohol dehydrogenase-like predicted oxidoreductase
VRYRPFANSGTSVSAVSLVLADDDGTLSADDWTQLTYAALEAGVNSFEVQGRRPALAQGFARALESVERRLVFVAWRIGPGTIPEQYAERAFQPDMVQASLQSALARTGLEHLDLVLLDDPGEHDLPAQSLTLLRETRSKGTVRMLGIAGEGEAIDAYISTGAFDALALPFNMASGWRERHRVRSAQERNMAVVSYGYCPAAVRPKAVEAPAARRGLFRRAAPAPAPGAYDFMADTPGWDPEAICLAWALTEPSIATVQFAADTIDRLEALADAAEREMPTGLAAQIEMARIAAARDAG